MRRLIVLPLLLLALVACGSDDEPITADGGPGDDPAGAFPLEGRTFVGGDDLDLVDGTELRLTVQDGQVGADAGCNQLGGEYTLDGDSVTVTQVTQTEMGCDPERADQDARIVELLGGPWTYALDDATLTLTFADGTVATLTDEEVAVPDAELVGPTWTLTTIVEGAGPDGTASSVPGGVVASITFRDGGVAVVESGCNGGEVRYAMADGAVTFTELTLEQRGCEGDEATVEDAVVAVLQGSVDLAIDGQQLTLTVPDGSEGLGFTA